MTTKEQAEDGFLTIRAASTFAGLSISTIRNRIRDGEIPAYKPSTRRILVSVPGLIRWMEGYRMYKGRNT